MSSNVTLQSEPKLGAMENNLELEGQLGSLIIVPSVFLLPLIKCLAVYVIYYSLYSYT